MLIGHQKQWEFLRHKLENGQLSHAYLLSGQEGIGKKLFASEFVKSIGCKFPDFLLLEKKPDKSEIEIGQIRDLQNFLALKSYYGGYKAALVDNAELMNTEAQNCFLKTLEEPKGDTLIFLVTSKPDLMLPTIFSRCQQIKFFKPKDLPENEEKKTREKEILKMIAPVMGADLADKFKLAKDFDFEKYNLGQVLDVFVGFMRQALLEKIEGKDVKKPGLAENLNVDRIKEIINFAEDLKTKFSRTNINQKLALEVLLMEI